MHVDIFASLRNQICPHFSLSCIFVLENSVVNLSERVDIFCKPEESHSSAARAATGNLCQKAQIAKSWKYFSANLTHRAASALGRASQPGKKDESPLQKLFCIKICELRIYIAQLCSNQLASIFGWELYVISGAADPGEHGGCGGGRGGNLLRKAWGSGNKERDK